MNATTSDSRVVGKVLDGERITAEDALDLYQLPLGELGQLADKRREIAKARSSSRSWIPASRSAFAC